MINTTKLFQQYQAAEAAMKDGDYAIELCQTADHAFAAYRAAIAAARVEWGALPAGPRKSDAETNAEDTEGTVEDELRFLEIALRTYEMSPELDEVR